MKNLIHIVIIFIITSFYMIITSCVKEDTFFINQINKIRDTTSSYIAGNEPEVFTWYATELYGQTARLRGIVNPKDLTTIVTFEYGTTTNYGNSVSGIRREIRGNRDKTVDAIISGLTPFEIYHYRVVASNSLGTFYGEDQLFMANLHIGVSYGGGLVIFIDESRIHGVTVAPSNIDLKSKWYNGTFIKTNAIKSPIYGGFSNTNTIVNLQGEGDYPAKLCYDLVMNGYNDWYLPSEFEIAWIVFSEVDSGCHKDSIYWSSTEFNEELAWGIQISNPVLCFLRNKSEQHYVRAVRAF